MRCGGLLVQSTIRGWRTYHNRYLGGQMLEKTIKKPIAAHAWPRARNDFYTEPLWVSGRLFDEEPFTGSIWDPACGMGHITLSAAFHRYATVASDIENRGGFLDDAQNVKRDFFSIDEQCDNIVTNPPFDIVQAFYKHAIELARGKVAMIFPTMRLNAARWLERTPLRRIWLLTPRPSMPPGDVILAGKKAQGGRTDYCWLVWDLNEEAMHQTAPAVRWLHRDRAGQRPKIG